MRSSWRGGNVRSALRQMIRDQRIRVAVPNVMGYDDSAFPKATYHAFWEESKGYASPKDGRPVYASLRPDFVWPKSTG